VSDAELHALYRGAKGLIFPSYEDYGIAPLEAQAWGVPVIAYGRGGSLETVKEGVSGIFFDRQNAASVVEALDRFEKSSFDQLEIRRWVSRFDGDTFMRGLQEFVAE
jgi:glycosyltransferase involved in cell wall biosynthesis